MSNSYDKFLRRLIQYREKLKLTQKEAGTLLGKDQSQLSKMELGKTVVSYEMLENLDGAGWDIDYLVTGKEKIFISDSISVYLKEKMGEEWKNLNDALIWIIWHELTKSLGCPGRDVRLEFDLLKLSLNKNVSESVLLAVRNTLGISQIVMAEKLGVNIKKYCQLEKGNKEPDAQLLGLIYELAYCRPGIFLHKNDVTEYLLDCLWNRVKLQQQKEALDFLDNAMAIYQA
jgi:transcriptional regulator with XRE-family HTH domain